MTMQVCETSKSGPLTVETREGVSVFLQFMIVSALALIVRLLFVFFVTGYQYSGGLDSYESMARNILEGKWLAGLLAVLLNVCFALNADGMRMRLKGILESSMRYSTYFKA